MPILNKLKPTISLRTYLKAWEYCKIINGVYKVTLFNMDNYRKLFGWK